MDYREELFKALTAGIEGTMRDKSIDALVEVCRVARKEGYNAGFKDGSISNGTLEEKVKEAYENGANDVWECVNKIYSKIDQTVVESIFDVKYYDVFEKFTASEAMAKVKEYEEEQKKAAEIKIGDEVTDGDGWEGVVTWISPDDKYLLIIQKEGTALHWKKESFKKTGRHFSQIAEVLQKMQEDDE